MNVKPMLLVALSLVAAAPAMAQTPDALVVNGTITKISTTSVSVRNSDTNAVESYKLDPKVMYVQNKPATLADIKPHDFVASAAKRGADGKLHSTELRIFPESMRGVGEGQRPMNDPGQQTMTNATVTGAAVVNGSNDIKVKYNGGESELILDPGVPVTRIDKASKSLVKAGVKVQLRGVKAANGGTVSRITIQ